MNIPRTDPNHGLYAWGTVVIGVAALGCLVVGANEIKEFNNSCTEAEIPLPQCYGDRLAEMTGQNPEGARQ